MIRGEVPDSKFPGLVRLSDIEPETVKWIWKDYIPRGKLTILEGDPSAGKSTITMAVAAAVSRGASMPCDGATDLQKPGRVIFWVGEDGLHDTVRRRADAAEGDVRLLIQESVDGDPNRQLPDLGNLQDIRCVLSSMHRHYSSSTRLSRSYHPK